MITRINPAQQVPKGASLQAGRTGLQHNKAQLPLIHAKPTPVRDRSLPGLAYRAYYAPVKFGNGAKPDESKPSPPKTSPASHLLDRLKTEEAGPVIHVLETAQALAAQQQHAEVTPVHILYAALQMAVHQLDSNNPDGITKEVYEAVIPPFLVGDGEGNMHTGPELQKLNIQKITLPALEKAMEGFPRNLPAGQTPQLSKTVRETLGAKLRELEAEKAKNPNRFETIFKRNLAGNPQLAAVYGRIKELEETVRSHPEDAQRVQEEFLQAQEAHEQAEQSFLAVQQSVIQQHFQEEGEAFDKLTRETQEFLQENAQKPDKKQEVAQRVAIYKQQQAEFFTRVGELMRKLYEPQVQAYEQSASALQAALTRLQSLPQQQQQETQELDTLKKQLAQVKNRIQEKFHEHLKRDAVSTLLLASVQKDIPLHLRDSATKAAVSAYQELTENLMTSAGGGAFLMDDEVDEVSRQAIANGAGRRELNQLVELIGGAKRAIATQNIGGANKLLALTRIYAGAPWQTINNRQVNLAKAKELLWSNNLIPDRVREQVFSYLKQGNTHGWENAPLLVLSGNWGSNLVKKAVIDTLAQVLDMPKYVAQHGDQIPHAIFEGKGSIDAGASIPAQAMLNKKRSDVLVVLDKLEEHLFGNIFARRLVEDIVDTERRKTYKDPFLQTTIDLKPMIFVSTSVEIPPMIEDHLFNDKHVTVVDVDHTISPAQKLAILKERLGHIQEQTGITNVRFSDEALGALVHDYTAFGRPDELDRRLKRVLTGAFPDTVDATGAVQDVTITPADLSKYLGVPVSKRLHQPVTQDTVGVGNGLAANYLGGGSVLQVQVTVNNKIARSDELKAKPKYSIRRANGPVGDMAKDSFEKAIEQYLTNADQVYNRLKTDQHNYEMSVNFVTPADGPSAGLRMASCAISAITGIPLKHDVAITGTVDAIGQAGDIGGVYEKTLAAINTGVIKKVLVPVNNYLELELEHPEIFDQIQVIPVKNMDEVLQHALADYSKLSETAPPAQFPKSKKKKGGNNVVPLQKPPSNDTTGTAGGGKTP